LLVAKQPVDRAVDIRYLRDGRETTARLTIAERKDDSEAARPHPQRESWLGIEVEEVSGRTAERLGLKGGDSFVVVAHVAPGSPADDAGIHEGDVILKVAGRNIEDGTDYQKASEEFKDRDAAIPFLLQRGELTQFVAVKPRK
jgi:serine protease Do